MEKEPSRWDQLRYAHDQYFLIISNDGPSNKNLRSKLMNGMWPEFVNTCNTAIKSVEQVHNLKPLLLDEKIYVVLLLADFCAADSLFRMRDDDSFKDYIQFALQNQLLNHLPHSLRQFIPTAASISAKKQVKSIFETTKETPKEPTMPTLKNITYIDNTDVTTMSDDQLITTMSRIETDIASLGTIKTKSTKIATKIADHKDTLAKVAAILDAR